MNAPRSQRGAAMLVAILLVALGTTLAASIAFRSAMAARRGHGNLGFEQSILFAQGAEAFAAYGLRENTGQTDDFSQTWAKPYGPLEIVPGVVLEAQLEDLQGRFNVNNLISKSGEQDTDALRAFQRLLDMLQIEPEWADKLADWLDPDQLTQNPGGMEDGGTMSQDPPYRTANTLITSTSELLALPGFGRERYQKLAPYITALPPGTKLNVCTAPGLLIDAMIEDGFHQYGTDLQLSKTREKTCSPTKDEFETTFNAETSMPMANRANWLKRFDQKSDNFRLTSLIALGGTEFALYSRLSRESQGQQGGKFKLRVAQRSFTPD